MTANDSSGYTLLELLVATAVLLAAAGSLLHLATDGAARSALWNESADLHQRSRVAAAALFTLLDGAAAGTDAGPLSRFLAAVEPKRRAAGTAVPSAITVRAVPSNAPSAPIASPLVPGAGTVTLTRDGGCADGAVACGFEAGMTAVVFDAAGNWDTLAVQAIGPDTLLVTDRPSPRSVTYPAGARVAQIEETTLYFEAAESTLRREQPGASNLPLIDNVVDLQFAYFGDPQPPLRPRPPVGAANCLYDEAGQRLPLPVLEPDHGALATLPLTLFSDGPMCGTGATAYDADLLRIRKIRVSVRLQTGVAILRGTDPRLFLRPGSARARDRTAPDVALSFAISPSNLR